MASRIGTLILIFAALCGGCSVTRYSSASEHAKPVIAALEKYKKDHGEYPSRKRDLVPGYIDKAWKNNVYYRRRSQTGYRLDIYLRGNVECSYETGSFEGCRWLGI